MESLYSRLAEQWDILFPPDPQRIAFIDDLIDFPDARIVEVGCGTGATALNLASLGYSVAASDLDPGMIMNAVASLENRTERSVDFSVQDMITAVEQVKAHSVHAILCLGNTLPYLTGEGELKRFFRAAGLALTYQGVLIIQILNYSRIMDSGELRLPDLRGDGFLFRRKQIPDRNSGLVLFDTEVISENTREQRRHKLFPFDLPVLTESAASECLQLSAVYGDWMGHRFTDDDSWLAAVFTRSGES
jgi:SAM-dependent methyltransferase